VLPARLALYASLFLALVSLAQADSWKIDPNHTAAQFAIRHLGVSTVRGAFTKVSGSAEYDPADLSKTSIDATIDASSVDTRVEMRDNDLRGPNFFDVQKYPTITFKSKRASAAGDGKIKITGDLTIHGVTKEVVLDVDEPTAPIKDAKGSRMGTSASTKINRKEFGVNGGSAVAADEVSITIDVELIQPAAK
jgi:polyisoprenoid-binding protein YceI